MNLYLNVHCSAHKTPEGAIIRAATEAFCKPPWVMGPANPATHAFISWTHGDHVWYRVDGEPPRSKLRTFDPDPSKLEYPTATWEVHLDDWKLRKGIKRAVELDGVAYGWEEIGVQILPGLQNLDIIGSAYICTHVATEVLAACMLTVGLPNRYPETLAQWAMHHPSLRFLGVRHAP